MKSNKYKIAMILSYIGLSVAGVIGIISLIFTCIPKKFDVIYNQIINSPTYAEYFTKFGLTFDAQFEAILWGTSIFLNVVGIIYVALCLFFVLKNRNDDKLTIEDFQKKNKSHIAMIVFMLLAGESSSNMLYVSFTYALYYISIISELTLLVAFFLSIIYVYNNYKQVRFYNGGNTTPSNNGNYTYTYSSSSNNRSEVNEEYTKEENPTVDVVEEEVKEVPKKVINQAALDELYDLLSKLDKEHRAGTINDEDYARMKETILNNYKNNS